MIETACWYIEAGMFGAAADVIVNYPLSRQSPQCISNLSFRIRNLANVGFDQDVSLPPTYFRFLFARELLLRFSFALSSDKRAGQNTSTFKSKTRQKKTSNRRICCQEWHRRCPSSFARISVDMTKRTVTRMEIEAEDASMRRGQSFPQNRMMGMNQFNWSHYV